MLCKLSKNVLRLRHSQVKPTKSVYTFCSNAQFPIESGLYWIFSEGVHPSRRAPTARYCTTLSSELCHGWAPKFEMIVELYKNSRWFRSISAVELVKMRKRYCMSPMKFHEKKYYHVVLCIMLGLIITLKYIQKCCIFWI